MPTAGERHRVCIELMLCVDQVTEKQLEVAALGFGKMLSYA